MLSFHVTSQVSRYLDGSFQLPLSPETDIWKKLRPNSNVLYILKYFFISLPINAKKSLLQHLFLQSICTFWSSIWSSAVEVPFICIDLCRFSILDVPPSGSENIPKPCCRLMVLRPRLSSVSSCKEITWDKCYLWKCATCAVHCKPD